MAGKLAGKVAMITGGASGIGRAIAELYAEEGADIVVADLQDGFDTIESVRARGRDALFCELDASNEASCETFAGDAVAAFGKIDILVAGAGITHPAGTDPVADRSSTLLINQPASAWQRVLDVNLNGVLLSNRAVARHMIEADTGGVIINIASIMAKVPQIGVGAYCVSKAGVWMLTKVLAMELARHRIRVNAIGPGFIETPMTADLGVKESGSWAMSITPMRRLGAPDEVASTALFLASDDASFYTGAMLHPHGGVFTD